METRLEVKRLNILTLRSLETQTRPKNILTHIHLHWKDHRMPKASIQPLTKLQNSETNVSNPWKEFSLSPSRKVKVNELNKGYEGVGVLALLDKLLTGFSSPDPHSPPMLQQCCVLLCCVLCAVCCMQCCVLCAAVNKTQHHGHCKHAT